MTGDYPSTPVLSGHARQRCAEMGISTKVAKAIVRHADVRRMANPDEKHHGEEARMVVTFQGHPEYAVVYLPAKNLIVTVVYRSPTRYNRIA